MEVSKRIKKGIEIKTMLNHLGISDELCPDLIEFSKILNNWIKTGEHEKGIIPLPEIKRKLVYKLSDPNSTVVKLII